MPQVHRLEPGSVFARDYKVVDLLAEGGMGAVYRAEQLSTRKTRALKLVLTRLATDPKGRERFVREATVGASIDSEHVVEVIGAGVDEQSGRPWLAMELLDGADLGAVVQHQGPLTPGQLREVMGQLCHGLAAAHRAGVVHRDLKPANVFVARSRRAGVPFTIKILDFGIAKVVQESGSGGTDTDTVGSPLWMAPEQLNAQRPTPATDVWALGLVAFWALTGKHYWVAAHAESSTVQALFVEQLFKPLVSPTRRAGELGVSAELIPAGFDDWFMQCMQRDAPRRFADAAAASAALQSLLPADPAAAAALLPDVALAPSISGSGTSPSTPSATAPTLATAPTAWGGSAVVPASAVAEARSTFEREATHADPPGLGADLSTAPLADTDTVPRSGGVSPLVVLVSVALVVAALAGGGYLVWQLQSQEADDPVAHVERPTASDESGSGGEAATGGGEQTPEATGGQGPRTLDALTAEPEPTDPFLELVVPLRNQLDRRVHEVEFLGWSESGHRFALQSEFRSDRDEQRNRLTVIEVRDALSGDLVESYLVSREAGEGVKSSHELSRAAKEAKPQQMWPARKAALKLAKKAPSQQSPAGGTLSIGAAGDSLPSGTTLVFPPSALGVAYRWTSTVDPPEGSSSTPKAPAMEVFYERDGVLWELLELEPPFNQGQLAGQRASDDPRLSGHLLAFWSPDGSRVLMLHRTEVEPADEGLKYRRWMLRAAGPQIHMVEAGAGQPRLRRLAAKMAAKGLPVAVAQLRAPPESTSSIIYDTRREGAQSVAEQIHGLIPGLLPAPEGKRKRGFTLVRVVLGHDAQ